MVVVNLWHACHTELLEPLKALKDSPSLLYGSVPLSLCAIQCQSISTMTSALKNTYSTFSLASLLSHEAELWHSRPGHIQSVVSYVNTKTHFIKSFAFSKICTISDKMQNTLLNLEGS